MNALVHISAEAFKGEGRSESYFIWSCDKRDLSMTRFGRKDASPSRAIDAAAAMATSP